MGSSSSQVQGAMTSHVYRPLQPRLYIWLACLACLLVTHVSGYLYLYISSSPLRILSFVPYIRYTSLLCLLVLSCPSVSRGTGSILTQGHSLVSQPVGPGSLSHPQCDSSTRSNMIHGHSCCPWGQASEKREDQENHFENALTRHPVKWSYAFGGLYAC